MNDVLVSSVPVGLAAGLLIGSWWAPVIAAPIVFATVAPRYAVDDAPSVATRPSEINAIGTLVLAAVIQVPFAASALAGAAASELACRPSRQPGSRWP